MYNILNFQGLISPENREEIITKEDVKGKEDVRGLGFLENFDSYCNNQEEDIVPKGSKKPYSFNAGNFPIDSLGKILSFFSHKEHGRFSIISRAVYKRTSTPIFKKLASSLIYLNDKDQKTKAKEFLFSLWVFKEHPDFEDLCKKQLLLYQKYLQVEKLYESLSEKYKTSDQGKTSKQVLEEIGASINKESKLPEQTLNKIEQHINYKTIEESRREDGDLSKMGLTCLPEAWIDENKELTKLHLQDNYLTTLPGTIGKLTELLVLRVDSNTLTTLPETIGNLTKLQFLWLHFNKLKSIPDTIGNLIMLRELELHANELTSLPDTIGNLSMLYEFSLGSNKLTSLPGTIGNLTGLGDFRLNNNKFTSLPKSICDLKNLHKLDIRENPLEWLPKCFKKMDSVIDDISDDELTLLCDCIPSKTKSAKRTREDIKGSCEQPVEKRQKLLEEMPLTEELLPLTEEECLFFSAGLTFSCESGEYEKSDLSSSIGMQKK